MAIVNEVVTEFSFLGDLKPQRDFNQNLGSSVKLLAGMAAGIQAASAGMFAWATSVFSSIDPMVQLHRETGVAVETIQELGYVASVNGSSADALRSSIAGLSKAVGDASRGLGRGKQAFEDLGISVRDSSGQVKSADVVLEELSSRFADLGLSLDEQRSIAASLGIDQSLIQMLNLTGDEMDGLRAKAQRLGIITQEQADAVADYNDSLTTLKFGMQGIQNIVAVGFAPMMGEMVDSFIAAMEANQDFIINGLVWLGGVVVSTTGILQRMWPVLLGIAAYFTYAKLSAIGFGKILSIVLSPVVLITAAIVAVILIIDDLVVAMQGGKSVIADFFMSFFGIDIVPILQEIVDSFKWMVGELMGLFAPLIDMMMHLFSAVVAVFRGDWEGALDSLGEAFSSWIEFVFGLFSAWINGIKGLWGGVLGYIKDLAMGLLPDWAIKLLGGVSDAAGSTLDAAGRGVDVVRGAASSAWDSVTGFFGGGAADEQSVGIPWVGVADEQATAPVASPSPTPMAPPEAMMPWDMGEPDPYNGAQSTIRDEAVAMASSGSTQISNSNVEQEIEINISTPYPERAGVAVQDALQRQLQDAQTMSRRGGR